MLGNQLRPLVKKALSAVARPLAALPLTPNQFTFLAVPLAGIAAFFISQQRWSWALGFVVLAILVDVLDGSVAEHKKMKTVFGNYWDATVDKIVECLLFIGFAFVTPVFAVLALAGTMLESYAKPRVGLVIVTDNHDWPAVGERGDRLLILGIGMLAVIFWAPKTEIIQATLALIFLVTLAGFLQRIAYARKLIEKAQAEGTLLPYLRAKPKKRQ